MALSNQGDLRRSDPMSALSWRGAFEGFLLALALTAVGFLINLPAVGLFVGTAAGSYLAARRAGHLHVQIRRLALFALLLAACSARSESTTSTTPPAAGPASETPARIAPGSTQLTEARWSARTVAEVLANLPSDQNFRSVLAQLSSGADADPRAVGRTPTLGAPIFVRGLRLGDASEYLVPVIVGDTTIAVMRIGLDTNGFGRLDATRGWSTASSFPAQNETAAIARGSTPSDPVVKAEFVWTQIRGSADELQPMWMLTRASGAAFFLFEGGALVSATETGP